MSPDPTLSGSMADAALDFFSDYSIAWFVEGATFGVKPQAVFAVYSSNGLFLGLVLLAQSLFLPGTPDPGSLPSV